VSISFEGPLADRLTARMEIVEEHLEREVRVGDARLDRATSHLAAAGGKRLRPALVLLTAELGPHPDAPEVIDSAVAVELTHLASLYHDDVMDDAPVRRGVPSAQHVFGNSVAILSGDVLFARASRIVAGLGPRAVALHATTFERLCTGQLNETMGVPPGVSPIDHYVQVLADKTGSLIAASARYGVISAGESEELAEVLAQFGEKVGVAFQLSDDVIDIVSDGETTGKTPGTDLREGVDTMPTLLLRQWKAEGTLDPAGHRILEKLDKADLSSDAALAEVVTMLRQHPVIEATRAMANDWMERGIAYLDVVPEGDVKTALIAYAQAAVHRAA
jgi:heptaprenyl diphosphate synthase